MPRRKGSKLKAAIRSVKQPKLQDHDYPLIGFISALSAIISYMLLYAQECRWVIFGNMLYDFFAFCALFSVAIVFITLLAYDIVWICRIINAMTKNKKR